MSLPGIAEALQDEFLREKAEKESERLGESLKKSVKAQLREIGVLRKELTVTVPAEVIIDHMKHNYDEIMTDAVIPGFRKGRAPRQLVERRFGPNVRESLKSSIVGQSFFAACENEKLDVLGDPLFQIETNGGVKLMDVGEALAHIELPEKSDFSYRCEIELRPTFELPNLEGVPIKMPDIKIDDKMVDEQILRQRKIRGRYEPVQDAAVEEEDVIIADVTLYVGNEKVKTEENVQVGVRPTRLDGIPLMNLAEVMKKARAGDSRSTDCEFPADYERTDLRGKKGRFDFKIHEIKRLVPLSNDEFMKSMGLENEKDLRAYMHDELEEERASLTERAKREQVCDYLLANTALDLPESMSARQTDRAVVRRVVDLQMQGIPLSEIEQHIDDLRTSARSQVTRDLKLGFILARVAEKLDISVTDEEVNNEISGIARKYNRRFDRVRDDLQKQGLLPQVAEQIRDDKAVTKILESASITKVAGGAAAVEST